MSSYNVQFTTIQSKTGDREEDEEEIVQRLQQYKRLLQGLQVELSTAKLQPKGDSYQENRKQLLAGADPTQRQRELQVQSLWHQAALVNCGLDSMQLPLLCLRVDPGLWEL